MATIQLSEFCWADSLKLSGREGKFEVSKAGTVKVSAYDASHYYGGKHGVVVFSESDRKELESLPERELAMLCSALECQPDEVVSTLLPKKKTIRRKTTAKKATPKKTETSE